MKKHEKELLDRDKKMHRRMMRWSKDDLAAISFWIILDNKHYKTKGQLAAGIMIALSNQGTMLSIRGLEYLNTFFK